MDRLTGEASDTSSVMPGLVPGISLHCFSRGGRMDARNKFFQNRDLSFIISIFVCLFLGPTTRPSSNRMQIFSISGRPRAAGGV